MYAGSADQSSDTTKRDIFENFKSYNLAKPELVRMDNHLLDRHIRLPSDYSDTCVFRRSPLSDSDMVVDSDLSILPPDALCTSSSRASSSDGAGSDPLSTPHTRDTFSGMFDVIVTDPPYGIRAGAKKSGTRSGVAGIDFCFCFLFCQLSVCGEV